MTTAEVSMLLATLICALVGVLAWLRANAAIKVSRESNAIAKEANKASNESNAIARDSNAIAKDAQKYVEDQNTPNLELTAGWSSRLNILLDASPKVEEVTVRATILNRGAVAHIKDVFLTDGENKYRFDLRPCDDRGLTRRDGPIERNKMERYKLEFDPKEENGFAIFLTCSKVVVRTDCDQVRQADIGAWKPLDVSEEEIAKAKQNLRERKAKAKPNETPLFYFNQRPMYQGKALD